MRCQGPRLPILNGGPEYYKFDWTFLKELILYFEMKTRIYFLNLLIQYAREEIQRSHLQQIDS